MKTLTVRNRTDDTAEVLLYGPIGADFFGDGVSARDFRDAVKSVKGRMLNLRVNSPGGSTIEASAMMQALDEWKGAGRSRTIECDVDGIAASAAGYLTCCGDVTRMATNALFMIHNPMGLVMGGADEMRRTADLLDKVKGQIVSAYQRKSKLPADELGRMMDAETWMTGQEAVQKGFADSCGAPVQVAAFAGWHDLLAKMGCKRLPLILAFTHNSKVADNEPGWAGVDKEALPALAFADHSGEQQSEWSYPHHWVEDAGNKDADGNWTTGTLYLHREGLNAAWAAAMGAHTGRKASQAVIDHLMEHRRALGLDEPQDRMKAETEKRRALLAKLTGGT